MANLKKGGFFSSDKWICDICDKSYPNTASAISCEEKHKQHQLLRSKDDIIITGNINQKIDFLKLYLSQLKQKRKPAPSQLAVNLQISDYDASTVADAIRKNDIKKEDVHNIFEIITELKEIYGRNIEKYWSSSLLYALIGVMGKKGNYAATSNLIKIIEESCEVEDDNIKLFYDEWESIRGQTAASLAEIGDPRAFVTVLNYVKEYRTNYERIFETSDTEPPQGAVLNSINYLGEMKQTRATDTLCRHLKNLTANGLVPRRSNSWSSIPAAITIVQALSKIGDKAAIPYLIEALECGSSDDEFNTEVIISLAHIDGANNLRYIIEALKFITDPRIYEVWRFMEYTANLPSSDYYYVKKINHALQSIEGAQKTLVEGLDNEDLQVRRLCSCLLKLQNWTPDNTTQKIKYIVTLEEEWSKLEEFGKEAVPYIIDSIKKGKAWNQTEDFSPSSSNPRLVVLGNIGDDSATLPLIKILVKIPKKHPVKYKILANVLLKFQNVEEEFERLRLYDKAIEFYNYHGMLEKAASFKHKKAEMSAPKTEIQGDYIDDRDTIIKDSVLNRSNVGAGGKTKGERIKLIKELLDSGAIDDDEFKQMKKEILGK